MPPIPLPDPELADDAIRLRPPAPEDVDAITRACQDPDVQHFTFVPSPYRTAHARDWIAGVVRSAVEAKGRRWSPATYPLIAEDLDR